MELSRFDSVEMAEAYGILCASLPKRGERDGLYPSLCRIAVGGSTTSHSHFEPEIFYITKGSGQIRINDESADVRAGDLVRISPFSPHQLTNTGDDELDFLSVYAEDFEVPRLPKAAVVTAAPPTPNGPLHLGHISGPYLASDVMTRFLRQHAVEIRSHSGTDDHQNYVVERARVLEKPVETLRAEMRARIKDGFRATDIRFNEFIEPKTDSTYQNKIKAFAHRALEAGVIQREMIDFPHCDHCDLFLVDALIDGRCPSCEEPSRGGCESCGLVVPPQDLLRPHCSRCETAAGHRPTEVLVFRLTQYLPLIQPDLERLRLSPHLRELVDRVCRMKDLKVLISHPDSAAHGLSFGDSDHSLHVWFEMAAHYECFALSEETWIHCFGFDNGFYYLLFIPALLRALNARARLPEAVISNEFLLLDGLKFSTSRGHAIWADEFVGPTDHLRLYLALQRPASLGANFSEAAFRSFSADLESLLSNLHERAHEVASLNTGEASPSVTVDCHRFIREMQSLLSPTNFDLRRAARRLLDFMDLARQSVGLEEGERLLLQTLANAMTPILPQESGALLRALGEPVPEAEPS